MNKVFKNFIAILSGNITGKILFFVFSIFIARVFGEDVFGSVNFANSIVTYFIMISSMGLQTYAVIKIAQNNNLKETLFNKILSTRIMLAIISTSLLIVIIGSTNLIKENKIMTLLYGSMIITNALNIDWYFNAIQKMEYISYSIMIQNIVSLGTIITIYMLNISKSMYIIPFSIFTGSISSIIYSMVIARKEIKFRFIFNIKECCFFIQKSFPFFFSGIFATINCNVDTILIGIIHNNVQVGIYSASYKIINILVTGISIIFTPVYPVMIELLAEDKKDEFNKLIDNLKKIILIIVVPLVLGGIILRDEIITLVFSNKYKDASLPFAILLLYIGLLYYREIFGYTLNAGGKQKKYMNVVCISAIINIILNVLFIPKYGIIAAAVTTVVSEMINLIYMKYYCESLIKIKSNIQINIKIILATSIMSIGIFGFKYLNVNVIAVVILSIIIYCGMIFVLRIIDVGEMKKIIGGKI